jgi:predicted DNA-binding transcriptional regulator YafY
MNIVSKIVKRSVLGLTQSGLKRPVKNPSMIRALLERAQVQNLVLKIEYVDEKGDSTAREIEVLEWDTTNIKARCRERKDYRNFLISRIKSAVWTGDVFDPADERLIEQGKKERAKQREAVKAAV